MFLFLHRWSALVGWLSVLECAVWGFLPFALLHLFPLFRLFVKTQSTYRQNRVRKVLTGARGLPRRLGLSYMCTAWLPVVPVVGAVPLCLCLALRWHRVRCDVRVVCWLDAVTAAWSGIGVGGLPFVARVALLACVGGLAFLMHVCLRWFPALVPACLCIPHNCVSL